MKLGSNLIKLKSNFKVNSNQILIKIRIKSFHSFYINKFILLLTNFLEQYSSFFIFDNKIVFLPMKIERFTVLRSPHVDKKAMDTFERRTHKRILFLIIPKTEKTFLSTLLCFLRKIVECSAGVTIKTQNIVGIINA